MNETSEVWRPVKGFEGVYEVSSLGRVKSLARVIHRGSSDYSTRDRILTASLKNGYPFVSLTNGRRTRPEYVHRLVAEAFIPNTLGFPCVNHKDETRTNNSVENLEWCTREYNLKFGTARKRQSETLRNKSRRVTARDKSGRLVSIFRSPTDASESTGIDRSSIDKALHGHRPSAGGLVWSYA